LDLCIGKMWCEHRSNEKTMNGTGTAVPTHSFPTFALNRWAAILAFDVQIERDAHEQAASLGRSSRMSPATQLNLVISRMQACESFKMMKSINSCRNLSIISKRGRKKSKSDNELWPFFRANYRFSQIVSSPLEVRLSSEYV
jgi:hypothetical protein